MFIDTNFEKIRKKNYKPWHVYRHRYGSTFLSIPAQFYNIVEAINLHNEELIKYQAWVVVKNNAKNFFYIENYKKKYGSLENEPPRPARIEFKYRKENRLIFINLKQWDDSKTFLQNVKNETVRLLHDLTYSPETSCYNNPLMDFYLKDKNMDFVDKLGKIQKISDLYEKVREYALKIVLAEPYNKYNDIILDERERLKIFALYLPFGTLNPPGVEMHDSYDYWITEIISKEPK